MGGSGHAAQLLGIFPRFGEGLHGGIQVSGRLAWEGLSRRIKAAGGRSFLFAFGGPPGPDPVVEDGVVASSRWRAASMAVASRRRAERLLVWHLGLLRLAPLLVRGRTASFVFLHGIECWRRMDFQTRWRLRRVEAFLSNSDHTWRRFLKFNPEFAASTHKVVPLGIGAGPDALEEPPSGPPTALILSRLDRREDYKGHRELLDAWPLVRTRLPEARLWIVGDGDLRPELERLAGDLNLRECVRFCGAVSESAKEDLLRRSRCLAMPSRGEGFGLVYLEAMRFGRPCLVSDCDAGREVVNPPEAGLEVDPGSARALADAMCRLLTDGPEWKQWSLRARQRYARHFTAQAFQERLAQAVGLA